MSRPRPKEVAAAIAYDGRGIFETREAVRRWNEAKEWVAGLSNRFFVEFRAPKDFRARVARVGPS